MSMSKGEVACTALQYRERIILLNKVTTGLITLLILSLAYIAYLSYALWLCMP
jgi:uncharacterized membrane protein YukC